jgi:gluconate 2-dehydrogenase gamma chain
MTDPNDILEADLVEILRAVIARLIPDDELGPGGLAAGADHYILTSLAGSLSGCLPGYVAGLRALDALARTEFGAAFVSLPASVQDEALRSLEGDAGRVSGGEGERFLELVREHAVEGFLGDPRHGGNRNEAGWSLIRYSPLGRTFAATEQGLEHD